MLSTGPDEVISLAWEECVAELCQSLCNISEISKSKLGDKWKMAHMLKLKMGNKTDPLKIY